jgi:hypothetical protein
MDSVQLIVIVQEYEELYNLRPLTILTSNEGTFGKRLEGEGINKFQRIVKTNFTE